MQKTRNSIAKLSEMSFSLFSSLRCCSADGAEIILHVHLICAILFTHLLGSWIAIKFHIFFFCSVAFVPIVSISLLTLTVICFMPNKRFNYAKDKRRSIALQWRIALFVDSSRGVVGKRLAKKLQ